MLRGMSSLSTTPLMKRSHSGSTSLDLGWMSTLRLYSDTPGSRRAMPYFSMCREGK